jgi:hyaluronoglucosaminidase
MQPAGCCTTSYTGLVALPGSNELLVTYDMIARPCPRAMCAAHPGIPCGCDLIVSMKLTSGSAVEAIAAPTLKTDDAGGATVVPAPYEVLWNSPWPTECADNPPPRGGSDPSKPVDPLPDWASFGVLTNNNSEADYNGETVATLYPHDTGLYPEILGSCGPEGPHTDYNCSVGPDGTPRTMVNGGIPQLLNLTAHLDKWAADIVRILPDPNWSGVVNLDWEAWNPDWEVNGYAEYQIYQNRSIELVLSQHPSWSIDEATPVAKEQFTASTKALWLETLALAKALRPHGKWGWYNFAHCMQGCKMLPLHGDGVLDTPLGSCKPAATPSADYNTRMMWLYTEVTALFPSIYLPCPPPSHHAASVPGWCTAATPAGKWNSSLRNIASVDCQMDAARYTAAAVEAATGVKPEIFAFGWNDYYPPNDNLPTGLFLSAEDASTDFARPALWGAAATIVWGESEDTFNNSQCNGPTSLGAYLNTTAGPIIHSAIEVAETCAADHCHEHGRCVNLPTKHCDCDPGFLERTDCANSTTELPLQLKTDDGSVTLFTPAVVDKNRTLGMTRTAGRVTKDAAPVLVPEHPWEQSLFFYHSIIEVGAEVWLYYASWTPHGAFVCLAKSSDGGRTFIKPLLHAVSFGNSTANNIILVLTNGSQLVTFGAVFVDEAPSAATNARFKMTVEHTGNTGMDIWASSDGISWHILVPKVQASWFADTQPVVYWDPTQQEYLAYGRLHAGTAPGKGSPRPCPSGGPSSMRQVGFSKTIRGNLSHWTNVTEIFGFEGEPDCVDVSALRPAAPHIVHSPASLIGLFLLSC